MSQRTRSVNDIIKDGFPKSLKLGILAFLWAVVLGIPLGVLAALKPNSIFDYFAMFFSTIGFVTELLRRHAADLLRGAEMGLVPTNGWPRSFLQFDDRGDPAVVRARPLPDGLFRAWSRARCSRPQRDYVRTARAKGLPCRRVIGLRNS